MFSGKKREPAVSRPGTNPYLNAREEWLERYGSYISRAAHWRMFAFICLIITGVSVAANVFHSLQYKVVPYIVEVDRLGKAVAVSRADRATATPERVVQAEVANIIVNWRTVTADIDLQKKMIERLSFQVAGSAKGVVRQWYEQHNPYEIAKKRLIHVEVKGLPLPVSGDSYRVEWTEISRSHSGVELERTTYEATVTVQISPPTSDAVIMKNPGGVYATAIAVAKLLRAGRLPADGRAQQGQGQ
jgi:type IV secretion system protein VirB5